MQTAKESKASINNSCKNIAQIIIQYDCDFEKLKEQTEKQLQTKLSSEVDDWEQDTEELLLQCSEVRDDLVTTFDACLAQPKQRTDIVRFYMDLSHAHILKLLGDYWEKNAIDLNAYQTLQMVDWAYQYNNSLA